jgi:hypothetical protein
VIFSTEPDSPNGSNDRLEKEIGGTHDNFYSLGYTIMKKEGHSVDPLC